MTDWEVGLVAILAALVAFLLWRLALIRGKLAKAEGERAALDAEEHRMFDFLHLLGESIASERSMDHLYRTIVEGVEEVLGADGAVLYTVEGDEFAPGYLSKSCPALVKVPAEVKGKGARAVEGWLKLGRVPRKGEVLDEITREATGRWLKRISGDRLPVGVAEMLAVPLGHGGKTFGVLAAVKREGGFSSNDWDVFRSAAEQSSFGLGNAMLHKEVQEKRRLDDELRTAMEVQRVLLPEENPDWPGYRVRGTNRAARLISGDYFDFLDLPRGQHGVVVADVSGKGVGAGLVMASCRSALRSVAAVAAGPGETLAAVNRQIFPDIRQDMFVSAAYVILENGTGRLKLARAGHDAPLLYRKAAQLVERVKPGGLALGLDKGPVFERVMKEQDVQLESGDVLLIYTDGVNEAENEGGEEFGKERLRATFAELAEMGAETVVAGLPRAVKEFAGNQRQMDDVTVVAIEKV